MSQSVGSGPASGTGGGEGGALAAFDRVYGRIEAAFNLIGAGVVFLLMLFVVAEVLAHSIIRSSIFGFLDVTELSMAAFAFLGAAYCQRLGGHIRMDLLVSSLRGRRRYLLEAFATLVALVVIVILVKATYDHAIRAMEGGDTTSDAELQTWPSKMLAPIGLALLSLRLLLQFVGYCRLILWPDATPVAVPEATGAGHAEPAD